MTVEEVKATEALMYGAKEAVALGLVDGEATLGEVLTTFSNVINRPSSGQSNGVTMATESRATYTMNDIEAARTDGHKAGEAEAEASFADRLATAIKADRERMTTALAGLLPNDKRVETFCELTSDGGDIDKAVKVAAKFDAPKAEAPSKTKTQADVDKLMGAHAPGVKGDGEDGETDPREKRLAQIRKGAQAYNKARFATA